MQRTTVQWRLAKRILIHVLSSWLFRRCVVRESRQACSSAGREVCRVKITFGLLPNNWFVSTKTNSMKYVINWVVFKRTCEVSEIQFTKHFIEFVFVETNEVVRTSSNMMLTRQTCGHCLRRAVGSKRRALAFYFSVRIRCMFLISTCEGKSDLGVCMTSVLAKRIQLHSADFRRILLPNTF